MSNYRGASNDSSGSAAETTTSTGGSTIAVANEAEPATVNSLEELATRLLRKVTKKSKLVSNSKFYVTFLIIAKFLLIFRFFKNIIRYLNIIF